MINHIVDVSFGDGCRFKIIDLTDDEKRNEGKQVWYIYIKIAICIYVYIMFILWWHLYSLVQISILAKKVISLH